MKMTKEHYTWISVALDKYKNKLEGRSYALYANHCRDSGRPFSRFMWDVLYVAKQQPSCVPSDGTWPVYEYLNDRHIETALRKYFQKEGIPSW